jgi:hypothetical protein
VTIDYRRFLGASEERVLPYLGGGEVIGPDRGLRVAEDVAPGWWRFAVEGRRARALERVEPADGWTAGLASVAGHWSGRRLVDDAGRAEVVHLLPEDELPRFAPLRSRRWHSGDLVFELAALEGEAEDDARMRFEDHAALGDVRGAPGSLRAAFALAVIGDVSARRDVPASALEVARDLGDIAEGGWPAADAVLDRLRAHRTAEAERMRARERAIAARPVATPLPGAGDPARRAADALAGSGARLLAARTLAGGLIEVRYRFLGERLGAVVQADSLQVVDAGVCLAGHDRELTLASLPGAVREGVETGQLVITRHD